MKITRRHLRRIIKEEMGRLNEESVQKPQEFIETENVGNDGKTIDDVRNSLKNTSYFDRLFTGKVRSIGVPTGRFFIEDLAKLGGKERHHSETGKTELQDIAVKKGLGGKITHLDITIDNKPSVVVIEIG